MIAEVRLPHVLAMLVLAGLSVLFRWGQAPLVLLAGAVGVVAVALACAVGGRPAAGLLAGMVLATHPWYLVGASQSEVNAVIHGLPVESYLAQEPFIGQVAVVGTLLVMALGGASLIFRNRWTFAVLLVASVYAASGRWYGLIPIAAVLFGAGLEEAWKHLSRWSERGRSPDWRLLLASAIIVSVPLARAAMLWVLWPQKV